MPLKDGEKIDLKTYSVRKKYTLIERRLGYWWFGQGKAVLVWFKLNSIFRFPPFLARECEWVGIVGWRTNLALQLPLVVGTLFERRNEGLPV